METIVLKGSSKESLSLLMKLAKKLGIEVSVLSNEAAEDIAMVNAIKKGKTGQKIGTTEFLKELRA